jgi:hypothetical protein
MSNSSEVTPRQDDGRHKEDNDSALQQEVSAFNRSEPVLKLKKDYLAAIKPTTDAYTKRVAERQKDLKQKGLPPLRQANYTADEVTFREQAAASYGKAYRELLKEENKKRLSEKKFPLPEPQYLLPDVVMTSAEDYLNDLPRNERFSDEEFFMYFPEMDSEERGENFNLSTEEMKKILQNESWLLAAIKEAESERAEYGKELDKLMKFNDLKKGKTKPRTIADLATPDYDNPKEVELFEKRADVLSKKAFFEKCLNTRKIMLEMDPDSLS